MRMVVDTFEFGSRFTPRFNTISISGYHIREAGSTAAQELAFTIADGTYTAQQLASAVSSASDGLLTAAVNNTGQLVLATNEQGSQATLQVAGGSANGALGLQAGGVGSGRQMAAALALGAQGVWSGTLWLTVEEADIPPKQMETYLAASSRDTVRSRSFTGKPCRMLKNDWTEAWEAEDTPDPLPMPLQMMVAIEAVSRGHRYPEQARDVNFNPCGQVIGRATTVRKAKDVVFSMVEEFIEASERLQSEVTV